MTHPAIRDLFLELGRHPSFAEAVRKLAGDGAASLSGLTSTAKAVYSVLLWQTAGRPLIIVVDGNQEAEALSETVDTFFRLLTTEDRDGPQLLPALDILPLQKLRDRKSVV